MTDKQHKNGFEQQREIIRTLLRALDIVPILVILTLLDYSAPWRVRGQ